MAPTSSNCRGIFLISKSALLQNLATYNTTVPFSPLLRGLIPGMLESSFRLPPKRQPPRIWRGLSVGLGIHRK